MKKQFIIAGVLSQIALGMSGVQAATTSINFEDLKEACQNPARFHNQNAPKNIEISCQDSISKYVPSAAGSVELPVSRTVTTSVASDKYSISANAVAVKIADTAVECPKFTKIIENLSLTRQVSCKELLDFQGKDTEFCLKEINEMRSVNPDAISISTTENVISLCEKTEESREQRGQRTPVVLPGRNPGNRR